MSFSDKDDAMQAFDTLISSLREQSDKNFTKEDVLNTINAWISDNFSDSVEDFKLVQYVKTAVHPDRLDVHTAKTFRKFTRDNMLFLGSVVPTQEDKSYFMINWGNNPTLASQPPDSERSEEEMIAVEKELQKKSQPIMAMLDAVLDIEEELDPSNPSWEGMSQEDKAAKEQELLNKVDELKISLDAAKIENNRKKLFDLRDKKYYNSTGFARKIGDLKWDSMSKDRDMLNEIENTIIKIRKQENVRKEAIQPLLSDHEKYIQLNERLVEIYTQLKDTSHTERSIEEMVRKDPNIDISSLGIQEVQSLLKELTDIKNELKSEEDRMEKVRQEINKDMDEGVGDQVLKQEQYQQSYSNTRILKENNRTISKIESHKNSPQKIVDLVVSLFTKAKEKHEKARSDIDNFGTLQQSLFDPKNMANTLKSMHSINGAASASNTAPARKKRSILTALTNWKTKKASTNLTTNPAISPEIANLPAKISNFMGTLESTEKGIARFEIARGFLNQVIIDNPTSPEIFKFSTAMIETLKDKEKQYLEATDQKYIHKPLNQIPVKTSVDCLRDFKAYEKSHQAPSEKIEAKSTQKPK